MQIKRLGCVCDGARAQNFTMIEMYEEKTHGYRPTLGLTHSQTFLTLMATWGNPKLT